MKFLTRCGLATVFVAGLSICGLHAQDPELTQFYAAPLYTNPASAGITDGGRAVVNYRNQWPWLPGTFVTFAASYDEHFDGLNGGIGLLATSDRAGEGLLTTNTFSGIYSHRIIVNRKSAIKLGIQAAYVNRTINGDLLRFGDQIEPREGFVLPTGEDIPNENIGFANFSTGAIYYSQNYYVGVAVHNLTEPGQSFLGSDPQDARLPRRFTVHGGLQIPLSNAKYSNAYISPNLLYMQQNEFTQLNLGFYAAKNSVFGGLWFRQTSQNFDAAILLMGFSKNNMRFGYSYDVTVSSASSAAVGSHELSFAVLWKKKNPVKRPGQLVCPKIGL